MKLPDDFWSVNEDEPGLGGLLLAFCVFVLGLLAVLGWSLVAWASR